MIFLDFYFIFNHRRCNRFSYSTVFPPAFEFTACFTCFVVNTLSFATENSLKEAFADLAFDLVFPFALALLDLVRFFDLAVKLLVCFFIVLFKALLATFPILLAAAPTVLPTTTSTAACFKDFAS